MRLLVEIPNEMRVELVLPKTGLNPATAVRDAVDMLLERRHALVYR